MTTTEVPLAQGRGLSPSSFCARRTVLTQPVSGGKRVLAGDVRVGYFLSACVRSGGLVCDVRWPF